MNEWWENLVPLEVCQPMLLGLILHCCCVGYASSGCVAFLLSHLLLTGMNNNGGISLLGRALALLLFNAMTSPDYYLFVLQTTQSCVLSPLLASFVVDLWNLKQ